MSSTVEQEQSQQQQMQFNDASYFQYQQGLFYEFLGECLVNWITQIKNADVANESQELENKSNIRTFIDTWCYSLFQMGIKRRIITYGPDLMDFTSITSVNDLPNYKELLESGVLGKSPEQDDEYLAAAKAGNAFQRVFYGRNCSSLLQFYYDKPAQGFNKSDPLTMFCRHLVFDLNTMSIVSVGVPGAINYESFITSIGSDGVSIEEYLEGTMVIYNQRLSQFGQQSVGTLENQIEQPEPNQKKPQNDWALSTRRKLGTSFFNNPGKSFDQMFRENNMESGTEFGDLDYLADKVLVFNVEHTENRVVNPNIINRNTLVAAYQLPTDFNNVRSSVGVILNAVFDAGVQSHKVSVADATNTGTDICEVDFGKIRSVIMEHARVSEIVQIPVAVVVSKLSELGVKGLRVPTKLLVYHGTDPLSVINSMIANMDQYSAGIMIKTAGETRRAKIRNPDHYELLRIKGSGPITISDRNKHNLFKVYWQLRQRGVDAIQQFLDVFDNNTATYKNIFTWYDILISGMNHQLFQEYHNVFVRKTMPAQAISYAFKPLCGELHKIYKADHNPITRDTVSQFVSKLEHNQVYWRLFGIDA